MGPPSCLVPEKKHLVEPANHTVVQGIGRLRRTEAAVDLVGALITPGGP